MGWKEGTTKRPGGEESNAFILRGGVSSPGEGGIACLKEETLG